MLAPADAAWELLTARSWLLLLLFSARGLSLHKSGRRPPGNHPQGMIMIFPWKCPGNGRTPRHSGLPWTSNASAIGQVHPRSTRRPLRHTHTREMGAGASSAAHTVGKAALSKAAAGTVAGGRVRPAPPVADMQRVAVRLTADDRARLLAWELIVPPEVQRATLQWHSTSFCRTPRQSQEAEEERRQSHRSPALRASQASSGFDNR